MTENLLFATLLLTLAAVLQPFTRWSRLPFTVSLLILGFGLQLLTKELGWDITLGLPTEVTYSLILPLMLFESAFHINFHQFKLQFKTITFLATFGVLVAIAAVGGILTWLIGLPLVDALLFGAIIASTDPISVVSLFKELGAPQRLSLVAEGESMFNDATGVIFFRLIAGFAITQQKFSTISLVHGVTDFLYLFVGSLLVGTIFGFATAHFIAQVKNDRLAEITLTIALAIFSFVGAEHFLHLSGVITTVAAGIVMGNIGRTKISANVITFMEEFWEYLAFLGVAVVFFFAAFQLDISLFAQQPRTLAIVILSTLIGRALAVYLGCAITNYFPGFKNEPNIPFSWQHVLNWGGLRGVIPLVLVYSLPGDYLYRDLFLSFTLACFVFTLLINATTIRQLLYLLKLHLPRREESILKAEMDLFTLNEAQKRLEQLSDEEFTTHILQDVGRHLRKQEELYQSQLQSIATPKELDRSLRLQIIQIERSVTTRLFQQAHIVEAVYFERISELDLQQDALEYPQLSTGRGYRPGGKVDSQEKFIRQLQKIRDGMQYFRFMQGRLLRSKERLILERLSLLQARIVGTSEAIDYLEHVGSFLKNNNQAKSVVRQMRQEMEQLRLKNNFQMVSIERDYPRFYQNFERKLVESLAWAHATD